MTRYTLLPLLGFLVACSDSDLMGPEADQTTPPPAQELLIGDPIQDALDRIIPAIEDQTLALELKAALRGSDAGAVEQLLVRLETDPAFAADADAIRLAITNR